MYNNLDSKLPAKTPQMVENEKQADRSRLALTLTGFDLRGSGLATETVRLV